MNRENEIKEISVEEILPNRFQPRLDFDEKELQELSNSIKTHGIIQPLVLRRLADKYEIIAGERRYKAACMTGLKTVPAIIMDVDDNKSAELAVVENLQRKNLTAIEEAQSYKKILDKGYLTQEQLASRMGVSQPSVANKMRLLNLTEEVQHALLKNQISERHARSLLALTEANAQIGMLNRIITEKMTVKQTEEEIGKLLGKRFAPEPKILETLNKSNNIFDVNVEDIKNNTKDLIEKKPNIDLDSLLKPQGTSVINTTKDIDLEETEANVQMGDIVSSTSVPINPFEETSPEILDFSQNTQTFEIPTFAPAPPTSNPVIDEFKQLRAQDDPNVEEETTGNEKVSLSKAINQVRSIKQGLEDDGFRTTLEEFDFEDMYQVVIKIYKD